MRFTVKRLRKTKKFTISQMSKKLGISTCKYLIYEFMPCYIPVEIAKNLSKICKVSVDDIFFG